MYKGYRDFLKVMVIPKINCNVSRIPQPTRHLKVYRAIRRIKILYHNSNLIVYCNTLLLLRHMIEGSI